MQKLLVFNPHNRITARDSLQHPYFKDELESIRTSSSLSESESLDTSDCRSDTPVSKWCWKLGTSQIIVVLTHNSLNPAVSYNSETFDCSIIWYHSLLCEFVILMSETNQILWMKLICLFYINIMGFYAVPIAIWRSVILLT